MSASSDPADALRWALNHVGLFWWVWVAIAVGISWTHKRVRDWNRRIAADPATLAARAKAREALMAALAPALAARQATAAAAAAPTAAAPQSQAEPEHHKHRHRHPAAAPPAPPPQPQRVVTPIARSVDVPATATARTPATAGTWTLTGAFGDPAHARTAIVVAEVLGPPVGLR